jgi:hypothetical protein
VVVTARDTLSTAGDQEIDIAFWNDQLSGGLRQFDPIILVECKNWSSSVSAREVDWFHTKLRDRGRPFGILVAACGITGDPAELSRAHRVIASALKEGRELRRDYPSGDRSAKSHRRAGPAPETEASLFSGLRRLDVMRAATKVGQRWHGNRLERPTRRRPRMRVSAPGGLTWGPSEHPISVPPL